VNNRYWQVDKDNLSHFRRQIVVSQSVVCGGVDVGRFRDSIERCFRPDQTSSNTGGEHREWQLFTGSGEHLFYECIWPACLITFVQRIRRFSTKVVLMTEENSQNAVHNEHELKLGLRCYECCQLGKKSESIFSSINTARRILCVSSLCLEMNADAVNVAVNGVNCMKSLPGSTIGRLWQGLGGCSMAFFLHFSRIFASIHAPIRAS
jgi:hypothetical protein